jgi:DNA replication protein DnaC
VRDLAWIDQHLNVLVTGPTGVGKSFLACALAHSACRADHSVRFYRLPRLVDELTRYHALQNRSAFLKQLAKAELLVLDDFGLTPLSDQSKRDLLEISTTATTAAPPSSPASFPVDQWHAFLADPTLADPILDRLVHNGYRVALKGESMRKQKQVAPPKPAARARKPLTEIGSSPIVSLPRFKPARHAPERWRGTNRNAGPASPEYA